MERSWTSANVVHALFRHFCHVIVFSNLGGPVLATLRGAGRDVMTVYAYSYSKGCFLRRVAFPRPGHACVKDAKLPFM